MSDIVDRLKEYNLDWRTRAGSAKEVADAIAEIEGLRAKLETATTLAPEQTPNPECGPVDAREALPKPEAMLTYASILEKPQYNIKNGVRYLIPTGEIIEAACAALRYCASLPPASGRDQA